MTVFLMRKVIFIAGSRGEYGYIRPIIKRIQQDDDICYEVLATNMHLLDKFGLSINEFKRDEIEVHHRLFNTFDGYNNVTMAKSLGVFLLQLPEILEKSRPDLIVLAGDRGEQLMAAVAGAHMNIPVVHIQAGEKSGNIDGQVRHSITKLSHVHMCSNEDAYRRVISLGEEPFRIFNTGAPLTDELHDPLFVVDNIREKLGLPEDKDIFLVVNHSISEEADKAGGQTRVLLDALERYDVNKVFIMPNSDAGSLEVRKQFAARGHSLLDKTAVKRNHVFYNLSRIDYVGLMRESSVMIGNSSSGIMEAPSVGLPVVNIGRRQIGRLRAKNVIDVEEYELEAIQRAVDRARTTEFGQSLSDIQNPYGHGSVSQSIVDILKSISLDEALLNKEITY